MAPQVWYLWDVSDRSRLTGFAQWNRKNSTRAERTLWRELRGTTFGVRFRRQDPIGPFIADFACRDRRLIVETDGISHKMVEKDYLRDRWFLDNGWTVLRFRDDEVVKSTGRVLDLIFAVLDDPSVATVQLQETYEHRWGFGSPTDNPCHLPLPPTE